MAEEEGVRRGERPSGRTALLFALLALVCSWNPAAAPFGLLLAVGATVLALRARRSRRPRLAPYALGAAILAAAASAVVLLLSAGAVSVEFTGEPIVKGRTPTELDEALSAAERRTREERQKARAELERLEGRADGGARGSPDGSDAKDPFGADRGAR
ncbi:MAG TPA: hypothetical protein VLV17_01445 [Anaeromyxobacteraceae bacterium]|nr:hypothetical protein [Anaeromyxobacteraceae bacterium]